MPRHTLFNTALRLLSTSSKRAVSSSSIAADISGEPQLYATLSPTRSLTGPLKNIQETLDQSLASDAFHRYWRNPQANPLPSRLLNDEEAREADELLTKISHDEHTQINSQLRTLLENTSDYRKNVSNYPKRYDASRLLMAFKLSCRRNGHMDLYRHCPSIDWDELAVAGRHYWLAELHGKTTEVLEAILAAIETQEKSEQTWQSSQQSWDPIQYIDIAARKFSAKHWLAPAAAKEMVIATRGLFAYEAVQLAKSLHMRTVFVGPETDMSLPFVAEVDFAYTIADKDVNNPLAYEAAFRKHQAQLDKMGLLNFYRLADGSFKEIGDPNDVPVDAELVDSYIVYWGIAGLSEHPGGPGLANQFNMSSMTASEHALTLVGNKAYARALAEAVGCPVIPGYNGEAQDLETILKEAARVGGGQLDDAEGTYRHTVMLKTDMGGGGRGNVPVRNETELRNVLPMLQARGNVIIESFLENLMHLEAQIAVDADGNVLYINTRHCSVQDKGAKGSETALAPTVEDTNFPDLRPQLEQHAVNIMRAVPDYSIKDGKVVYAAAANPRYKGVATVEFFIGPDGKLYFGEVNPRPQVERKVTEQLLGINILALQLHIFLGGSNESYLRQNLEKNGVNTDNLKTSAELLDAHYELSPYEISTEVRINATKERIDDNGKLVFDPHEGLLTTIHMPPNRPERIIDHAYGEQKPYDPPKVQRASLELSPHIVSVIAGGKRTKAEDGRQSLIEACGLIGQTLGEMRLEGPDFHTNIDYQESVVAAVANIAATEERPFSRINTGFLNEYVNPEWERRLSAEIAPASPGLSPRS